MSSTKYGVSSRERWRLNSDHNTTLSNHALERWDERTPAGSVAPERAFDDAIDVSELADRIGDADRVRYYYGETDAGDGYAALFMVLRRPEASDVCRTVLVPERVNHGPTRAYLAACRHLFDTEGSL